MSFQDDIKQYLQTGDFPTQTQFYEWLSKIRWIDVLISESDLDAPLAAKVNAIVTTNRPEERSITGNTTIVMLAKFKFVGIAIKNPSAFDLVFHLNYPALTPPPGTQWQVIEVPANSTIDFQINQTFWTTTSINMIEQTGVDFSATPVILLIDRK